MNTNPIVIIDDDKDDLDIIRQAFNELNIENEIIFFENGFDFMDFIRQTPKKPFFILCDINMPKLDGIELKQMILDDSRLRLKCIPFLLFSTSKASASIVKAYSYDVQGYFTKPSSIKEYQDILYAMIVYWSYSQAPNSI